MFFQLLFVWQGHYASFGVFSVINIMRIGVAELSNDLFYYLSFLYDSVLTFDFSLNSLMNEVQKILKLNHRNIAVESQKSRFYRCDDEIENSSLASPCLC